MIKTIYIVMWLLVTMIAAANVVAVAHATKDNPWLKMHIPGDLVAAICQLALLVTLMFVFYNSIL